MVIEEPNIDKFIIKWVALAEKLFLMQSHFSSSDEIIAMINEQGFNADVDKDDRFILWVVVEKK